MFSFANASEVDKVLANLRDGFAKFPQGFAKKWIRQALKNAVADTGLEGRFKSAAPVKKGNLRKSVTIVTGNMRSGPSKGQPYARVGYGRSKGKKGYHAILVSDGTKDRYTKGFLGLGRAYRGRGPATGFANGVLATASSTGPVALERHLQEALDKATAQFNSPKYQARMAAWKAKRGI